MNVGIGVCMSAIKDEAICIGSTRYSESSQIVTLFSKEHGLIKAIAKGARRPKGKFGGGIDLLTAARIIFSVSSSDATLALLHEYVTCEPFGLLRNDLLALNCGQFAGDMLSKFTECYDPHELLYSGFYQTLGKLQLPSNNPLLSIVEFQFFLFQEVGLSPVFSHCSICGKILPEQDINGFPKLYFSSHNGGMLCRVCEASSEEKRMVQANVLALLKQPHLLEQAESSSLFEVFELLSYHQREQTGKQSPISTFLNQLFRGHLKKIQ